MWVETSDIQDAGTDAHIEVYFWDITADPTRVYDDSLTLSDYDDAPGGLLDTPKKDDFERGSIDTFWVPYIRDDCKWNDPDGMPALISVWHDNEYKDAGWHLKRVVLENSITGKRWEYPCNAWFDPPTVTHTLKVLVPVKKQLPYGEMPRGGMYHNILNTSKNHARYYYLT